MSISSDRSALRGLAMLGLVATAAAAQQVSLHGTWEIAVEPASERTYDRRVQVPAPFETSLGNTFDGVAWYRRTLPPVPLVAGVHASLRFDAVATHATVVVNGREIGQHLGGWTPFTCDVPDGLLRGDGSDVLEVRVDERVGHNTQGFLPIVQPHFGGIWQDVRLCLDDDARLDDAALFTFGHARPERGDGHLQWRVKVRAARPGLTARVEVLDGAAVLAASEQPVQDGAAAGDLELAAPLRYWAPGAPHLYGVRLTLLDGGRELDRAERQAGFRELRADGTRILWNGAPLQVRGLLHWGCSPPSLAPSIDPRHWRQQIEDCRSLGFNLVKCCLWVPPRSFYELCDRLGLLVWQEYPTWHPKMDAAHRVELRREYEEFFAHDGSHASVAFRSLTCETGHDAELAVIQELFDACKAAVPQTLVVDDSSWIGWQRVTDFWDEHPYGNNRWWPGRLREFQQHIERQGRKPLLLGECIAADTWADLARWQAMPGDCWWRPLCFDAQVQFESWLGAECGADTLATLAPIALDYGMRTRRYQIERLRLSMPDAGYVVSVARDFAKARMGLYDDFDRLKWTAAQWSWQRDAMLCLDTADDRRAMQRGEVAARAVHAGAGTLRGRLQLTVRHGNEVVNGQPVDVAIAGNEVGPAASATLPALTGPLPRPLAVTASLRGDAGCEASWTVWQLPAWDDARPNGVEIVDRLTPELLDRLAHGARVLLRASGQKQCLRNGGKWYLTGAPFAPPHPVHAAVPLPMLLELQPFDLDGGRLFAWELLAGQVDPILAFWETHDIAEVRRHLFAFDCRVGQGRLLASAFDRDTDAGRYVEHALLQHLAHGPAPRRELTDATIAALRALLTERRLDLPTWRFRTDPDDQGAAANWHDPATDVAAVPWRDLQAGSHWENQGDDLKHYTGVAWYRVDVEVPPEWQGQAARAVFDGVDDSFTFWLNGDRIGSYGDPATGTTIWLQRQVAELGERLRPGRNTLVLRVVDHQGAGGLWKGVFLTTGPADDRSKLLN